MLRNPVPWLCLTLSVWALWTTVPEIGEWPGSAYEGMTPTVAPLLFGISVAVAVTFHRGRTEVAPAAQVQEERRTLARLLAAIPFLGVTAGFAGLIAWRERDLGGLWIGMEPGRTTEALANRSPSCPSTSPSGWSPWRWVRRSAGACRGWRRPCRRSSCCGSSR